MNKFLKDFKEKGYFYQCTDEKGLSDILNKQKINPKVLKMEVKGHRHKDQIPALFYQIDINIFLEGDFSPEKAKRAAQLSFEKYCSVSKTLEPTAKINHHIILNGKKI